MTAGPTIDYETLAQDAMRGVVRTVLQRAAKTGLPGDHHFYISFDTEAPGASISKRLKEKYPNEMTIVLQHRFWDLLISDDRFEVKLTFDGIPERLVVPFASIKVFFDPSVRYGLQFEDPDGVSDGHNLGPGLAPGLDPRSPRAARKPRAAKKPARGSDRDAGDGAQVMPLGAVPMAPVGASRPQAASSPSLSAVETTAKPTGEAQVSAIKSSDEKAANSGAGAQIVSLDQFRKK